MKLAAQTIKYRDGDIELSGLFYWDDSDDCKRAGVLVVHGGAGLDEHAKAHARKLASRGFVAFACDMYGNGVAGNRERVMARIAELRTDTAKLCRRAGAGMDVLASHPKVDGRLAAIGYCFGGMTVLELARHGTELAGAISVHGSLATDRPAQQGCIKAKLLICHGALDPHVPMQHVNQFMEEMTKAGADWQLIVYGDAMHGFTHETGSTTPGVAYSALASRRSDIAVQNFLEEIFDVKSVPTSAA